MHSFHGDVCVVFSLVSQLADPASIHPAVAGRHATHTDADRAATATPAAHHSHSHGRLSSVFQRQRPPVPTRRRRISCVRRVSPGDPHHAPSGASGVDAVVLPFAHALARTSLRYVLWEREEGALQATHPCVW